MSSRFSRATGTLGCGLMDSWILGLMGLQQIKAMRKAGRQEMEIAEGAVAFSRERTQGTQREILTAKYRKYAKGFV